MKENEPKNYENLNQAIAKTENIGVIGSPSSTTEIKLDVLKTAVEKGLVGAFSFFTFQQDGKKHCTLGQITEINLRNPWVEDATMRGLIRQKGRVDPITERQDTHNANMTVGAVFEETDTGFNQGLQGNVPPTGTSINLVDDFILNMLLKQYQKDIFYLGKVYGSKPLMPMWFRHFGKENDGPGGIGEAYHLGVFGKTGSGKSKLAEMILLGYARHSKMSIFIIDPQGEFTRALRDESNPLSKTLANKLNKEVKMYDVQNLTLTVKGKSWDRFKKILSAKGFLDEIGVIDSGNKERAAAVIVEILNGKYRGEYKPKDKKPDEKQQQIGLLKDVKIDERNSKNIGKIAPSDAYKRESFDILWECLKREDVQKMIYTSEIPLARIQSRINHGDPDDRYETWKKTAKLFSFKESGKGVEIEKLVEQVTAKEKGSIQAVPNLTSINPKKSKYQQKTHFAFNSSSKN